MSVGRLQPVHHARKSMLIPEEAVAVDVRPWTTGSPARVVSVVSSATDVSPVSNVTSEVSGLCPRVALASPLALLALSRQIQPTWHLADNIQQFATLGRCLA